MSGKQNIEQYSPKYFGLCGLGGIIACGLTHGTLTPVDVVKCRMQTGADYSGMFDGLLKIAKSNKRGLLLGAAPTAVGYAVQGLNKFGFYEVFKHLYGKALGDKMNNSVIQTGVYMCASASAEFIADIFLCPFEAVKVRIQTSPEGTFETSMFKGMKRMYSEGGLGIFYRGIVPLWTRQIPYTIIKFTSFERIVGTFYKRVWNAKPRNEYSKAHQLGVSFISGYIAGVFCAIVSHPADVLVSKMNKNPGKSLIQVSKQLGWKECWTGLTPRIFMIGTLTALQWYIYDSWKTYWKFPTSGGH